MIKNEIKALEKAVKNLSLVMGVEKIIAFGSRVRGDFKGDSDLDLLIILNNIGIKNRVISILHDIELEFDVPISPVIFTNKEYNINKKLKSSFIENLQKDGITIYDSEHKREGGAISL